VIVTRVVRLPDGEELVSYDADVPDAIDERDPRTRVAGRGGEEALERFPRREAGSDEGRPAVSRGSRRGRA
jgi:hypothetical protein